MKKVLITGITGMVGSHLADYLIENTDWEIYGLCRWRSPLDNIDHLIDAINNKKRIHLVYGELRDSLSLDNIVKDVMPDYVFHLAAQSYPKTSFDAPLDTLDTNIQPHPAQQAFSYLHLLILAKKLGKSFEEQLGYAQKMLSLYDNNRYKLKYGYFLFENKRFDLFYDYFKSLSLGEIILMVCHSLCPGFEQAVIGRDLENFLFAILTTNVVRKKRNFATLKRQLPDFYKPLFYHIYKKPLFRLRVHYYHLFHKKLH